MRVREIDRYRKKKDSGREWECLRLSKIEREREREREREGERESD